MTKKKYPGPKRRSPRPFWENAFPEPMSGCWLWDGPVDSQGYGKASLGPRKGRANRFAYELTYGAIPHGQMVRHRCDTPACINPDHLVLGTLQENADDRVRRGRGSVRTGEHNPYSKLTDERARQIFSDPRPYDVVAAEHGVSENAVSRIKCGRTWQHLGLGLATRHKTPGPRLPSEGPPKKYRPKMTLRMQINAVLRHLGLDPNNVEWHHSPPLSQRGWDGHDTIPPANDDRYLIPMAKAAHRKRTAEIDIPATAKMKRNAKAQLRHVEAMEAKVGPPPPQPQQNRGRKLSISTLAAMGIELEDSASSARQTRPSKWPKGRKIRSRGFQKREAHV